MKSSTFLDSKLPNNKFILSSMNKCVVTLLTSVSLMSAGITSVCAMDPEEESKQTLVRSTLTMLEKDNEQSASAASVFPGIESFPQEILLYLKLFCNHNLWVTSRHWWQFKLENMRYLRTVTSRDKLNNMSLKGFLNRHTSSLCRLQTLDVTDNSWITSACVSPLTSLTHLNISNAPQISYGSLAYLTNLKELICVNKNKPHKDHLDTTIPLLTSVVRLNVTWQYNFKNADLDHFPNVTRLDITGVGGVTDDSLTKLTALKNLTLYGLSSATASAMSLCPTKISKKGLLALTGLTSLELKEGCPLKDDEITDLSNLTALSLHQRTIISEEGLGGLTHLVDLSLREGCNVKNVSALTNLKVLCLGKKVQDVSCLPNLKDLEVYYDSISNATLSCFPKLRSLKLNWSKINNEELSALTGLTALYLRGNRNITNEGVSKLPNLTSLEMVDQPKITPGTLDSLPNLKKVRWEDRKAEKIGRSQGEITFIDR